MSTILPFLLIFHFQGLSSLPSFARLATRSHSRQKTTRRHINASGMYGAVRLPGEQWDFSLGSKNDQNFPQLVRGLGGRRLSYGGTGPQFNYGQLLCSQSGVHSPLFVTRKPARKKKWEGSDCRPTAWTRYLEPHGGRSSWMSDQYNETSQSKAIV